MTSNVIDLSRRRVPKWEWSDRVRRVRKDMGMTQAQFAEMTGFGEKRIAAWESGRNPRPDDIGAVAVQFEAATGVDRLWWIGWTEGPTDPRDPSVNSGWSRHRTVAAPRIAAIRALPAAA